MIGSKEIDTINHVDTYDSYKDLYLSEKKKREEKLLQGIQSANNLKARVQAKEADSTIIITTTKEKAIKKIFGKRFPETLDCHFFLSILYIPMEKIWL